MRERMIKRFNAQGPVGDNRAGCWCAHMDALSLIIRRGLRNAIVVESDAVAVAGFDGSKAPRGSATLLGGAVMPPAKCRSVEQRRAFFGLDTSRKPRFGTADAIISKFTGGANKIAYESWGSYASPHMPPCYRSSYFSTTLLQFEFKSGHPENCFVESAATKLT